MPLCRTGRSFLDDSAVTQMNDAVGKPAERRIVRHNHQCRSVAAVQLEQHLQNEISRCAVKVSRRLISEQERGTASEGSRERHSLLLSPGQLSRIVRRTAFETDGRQQLHFRQLFAAFRWHPQAATKLAHVWFGSILGEDGKPFKTRSGQTIGLSGLLDEAEERAFKVVSEKSPDLPESQRREIARIVGVGAVKYADLLPNRQSDYVFSWNKLLALNGNTAPYLQYAWARIRSIFRKAGLDAAQPLEPGAKLDLSAPEEIALAKRLLGFGPVLEAVAQEYRPNFLCNYLFELATGFTAFYENCSVLKSEPAQRASRLVLCDLTARTLKQGLETLGLGTIQQM